MKQKIKPFVSIVIPTRDRVELLVAVLAFIKKQTFDNFEVIISDNGVNELCYEKIKPYLVDDRFTYKRPDKPLEMCEHWDFAIEGAQGEYISVFNEKFILRRDALQILFDEFKRSSPDVMTWQFDYFEAQSSAAKGYFKGTFHPRIKPNPSQKYDNVKELERRFSFEFPSFCRKNKHLDSYGKIYGGLVKNELVEKIKQKYGRMFYPGSPDFTSMIAILNEGKTFVDISQSLMLLINQANSSNGFTVSTNAKVAYEFMDRTFADTEKYMKSLLIKKFWIGIENHLARDYIFMQSLAKSGPVKNLILDKVALAVWVKQTYDLIENWDGVDHVLQLSIISDFIEMMTVKEKQHFDEVAKNISVAKEPNSTYIYHSGIKKSSEIVYDLSAEELAKLNWHICVANQATNISTKPISLEKAESYLYEYNFHSCMLLGIDNK